VATAYLKNREDTAKSLLAAQVKRLRSTYKNTNKALTKATADVLRDKSDSHDGRLAAAHKALLTKKTAALRKQLTTDQRIDTSPGIVVQAASLPTEPAGMSKALLLMSGLTAGILLGLLATWVLARRPTRTAKT
jgi:succinoglycan biosynthesis transport protein ExoP